MAHRSGRYRDALLGLTDEGIAYVARGRPPFEQFAAVRIFDGTELWRTPGVAGYQTHLIVRENVLYCAHLSHPSKRAEVVALDPTTGVVRWRWRSPGWLPSLLALWGRYLPRVLLFVAAQARRSFIRSRDRRDRSIFYREVIHGQWRHPCQLVSNVTITADAHTVYVGTSLGLIALRARRPPAVVRAADDGPGLVHPSGGRACCAATVMIFVLMRARRTGGTE